MKKKSAILMIIAILFTAAMSACSPGEIFGPTTTPSPTNTVTPTVTLTPKVTATATPTATPEPACQAKNGSWSSNESSGIWGPILTFSVNDCKVVSWETWVYPVPGELLFWQGSSSIEVVADMFSHNESTDLGVFTINGTFDSPTSAHGTLLFPKGFSVFGTVLTEDVSVPWTAHP